MAYPVIPLFIKDPGYRRLGYPGSLCHIKRRNAFYHSFIYHITTYTAIDYVVIFYDYAIIYILYIHSPFNNVNIKFYFLHFFVYISHIKPPKISGFFVFLFPRLLTSPSRLIFLINAPHPLRFPGSHLLSPCRTPLPGQPEGYILRPMP